MTPSAWHDDAPKDAGHDKMQADFVRYYRGKIGGATMKVTYEKDPTDVPLSRVIAEFPISAPGNRGIIAFADVALRYDNGYPAAFRFVELKPRIRTVGGLVRQCRAIEYAAGSGGLREAEVIACVFDDDPKLDLLRELYPHVW